MLKHPWPHARHATEKPPSFRYNVYNSVPHLAISGINLFYSTWESANRPLVYYFSCLRLRDSYTVTKAIILLHIAIVHLYLIPSSFLCRDC